MIKNKTLSLFLAASVMLSTSFAFAADCKFAVQQIDPATGKQKLATKFVGVSAVMAKSSGAVQFVSRGDDKLVAVRLRTMSHYPVPPELNINLADSNWEWKTGKYDARLKGVLAHLKRETAFVPAGSTLRITLEDRSVIVLHSEKDAESNNVGTSPLLNGNESPNFVITSQVFASYPLDADAINVLTARRPISMRMATAERYYEFAARMNAQYPLTWGKKNGQQFQEGLNCVL